MGHHPFNRKSLFRHFFLLSALVLAFPRSGWSDGLAKMDAPLSQVVRNQSDLARLVQMVPGITLKGGEAYIKVFIEMQEVPASLRDHGVEILSRAGTVSLARLPLANLEAVASLPGIVRLEADARVEPFLDLSIPDIGADRVWQEKKYGNLQGSGVIVGMVDSGISSRHVNFMEPGAAGTSRILWVWDQGDDTGPAPEEICRDYTTDPPGTADCEGTECSPRSGECEVEDGGDHGTLVMGVMAGNGQADCGEELPCSGVAPKGEMIVVGLGEWLASEVIQGVDYIFQKAAAVDKPAVVNLSVGWYPGSRDGTSLLERHLSGLTGPGRIIVAAAGNEALEMGHTRMESDPQRRTLFLDCIPTPDDSVWVYGWYDPPDSGSVEVRVLNFDEAVSSPWVPYDEQAGPIITDSILWGKIVIQHGESSGDARGFTIILESGTSQLRTGQWHIEVRNPEATGLGTTVDVWIDRSFGVGPSSGSCPKPARFRKADEERETTIAPPCTADDVICTGSYNTRCMQGFCSGCSIDYGAVNCIVGFETKGDISSFSSLGPARDGSRKPWLAAPGQAILTPDNGGETTYSYASGTSFAAPHVAGTVALMLEANPNLTPAEALDALRSAARRPEGVSVWDEAWGWGKVDAYGAVEKVASEIPPPPPPPPIEPTGLGGDDDICFIATAAFGDVDAPQVALLREMRDKSLLKTSPGRRFVRFYYRWSPPLAAWLKEHKRTSRMARLLLMPLAGMSEVAYHRPGSVKSVIFSSLGLFLLGTVCYSSWKRRTR